MTTTALQQREAGALAGPPIDVIHQVVLEGDLNNLTPDQRLSYVDGLCNHLGISAAGKPFDLLKFQGKMVAYPNKGCAEQLRLRWRISFPDKPDIRWEDDTCYVSITGRLGDRTDTDTGAVYCKNVAEKGAAVKKALTQAKRRVTLSLVGLSLYNEDDFAQTLRTIDAPAELPPADPTPPSTVTTSAPEDDSAEPSKSSLTRDEFLSQATALGEEILKLGLSKAAYRQVLNEVGARQANHVTEEHYETVLDGLRAVIARKREQDAGQESPDLQAMRDEVAILEATKTEEELLDAWDQAVGVDADLELDDLDLQQLTAYRDLLK